MFWVVHFTVMWLRAQLRDRDPGVSSLEDTLTRLAFALFGVSLSYVLYRCLRDPQPSDFVPQALRGAVLALAVACVQGAANGLMLGERQLVLMSFLYFTMYWFWFYFCWAAVYFALSYSLTVQEQERATAQLRIAAQSAQNRALRYQINPHFLFNTLNAIAALVRDAPQRAEAMVVQLSDFFRRSLAINPMEDLTLAEEIDLQRLYLEIEHTRFPARLRFKVALAEGSAEARVPALLLQPLVENAVKHGVARSESPVCICIRARIENEELEVVVENDAAASGAPGKGEGIGLTNVEERLRTRFGDHASLVTETVGDGGFRNTLRIPLIR